MGSGYDTALVLALKDVRAQSTRFLLVQGALGSESALRAGSVCPQFDAPSLQTGCLPIHRDTRAG